MPNATIRAKAGWTTVTFGDVVRQVKDQVDPEESDLERYVAGEHMDTGCLRIRRWGKIGDGYLGPAFHMRFKPGHVLYGSRRTYLRKIAIADFEGVTANTTYVLESADPKVLLPELLPFIMQTEVFSQHSIRESKGSVNPYVNFSDLAWFEFALPPMEEQERIARAAGAIQAAREALDDLALSARRLQTSVVAEAFGPSEATRTMRLDDVLSGIIDYRGKSPPKSTSGVPLLTARNVRDGFVDPEPREFIPADRFDGWMTRGLPEPGDVLFTTEAPLGNVAVVPAHKFALGQRLVLLRANAELVSPRYLFWLMRSTAVRREILAKATGTTAVGIKQSLLRQVVVNVAPREDQDAICGQLDAIDVAKATIQSRSGQLRCLAASILRELSG